MLDNILKERDSFFKTDLVYIEDHDDGSTSER